MIKLSLYKNIFCEQKKGREHEKKVSNKKGLMNLNSPTPEYSSAVPVFEHIFRVYS